MSLVEVTAVALVLAFYIIVLFLGFYLLYLPDIRANKLRRILMIAIKNDSIKDIEDVYTLFKGVNNFSDSTSNDRRQISKTLGKLNVHLIKKLNKLSNENDIREINKSIGKVKELLEENDKITPFSELPTHERFVVEDTKSFLNSEDYVSASRKIDELANFLIIANERKNKSEKQSKLSITLTVISIFITVVLAFWKL